MSNESLKNQSVKKEGSEVTVRLEKLTQFMKDLSEQSKDYVVKVGVFGDRSSRADASASLPVRPAEAPDAATGFMKFKGGLFRKSAGVTNPELAAIHEFGRMDGSIPKRSFLRLPLALKQDEILRRVKSGANFRWLSKGQPLPVLRDLGHACEAIIQEAFASRGYGLWKPTRRGGSPLIDTGQLRRSVASKVEKDAA